MEIKREDIERKYSGLSDNELITLRKSKGLTDTAKLALKTELSKRGLTANRITEIENEAVIENNDISKEKTMFYPPRIWVLIVFAVIIFISEIIEVSTAFKGRVGPTFFASILGYIYWLYCVQRYHAILGSTSKEKYPISPGKAVGFHFIPLFNIYWLFKWPIELSSYFNNKLGINIVSGFFLGLILFIAFLVLGRIDSILTITVLFFVGLYINKKFKILLTGYKTQQEL